ncbi:hypothetical protein [Maribacter sp. MAR_2009_72]|uniref:hypothetical protein n=1 Tax=Maribacter sp. MAR_2009_72 TaxID=1250050 RepID=UPI00119B4AB3|nr:hypothetical protein [Maribacter sp. MAR_2009_72]TVZ16464.1 hypothetical protein JM81_2725 [Maribacter sp. MAR_2009_72]
MHIKFSLLLIVLFFSNKILAQQEIAKITEVYKNRIIIPDEVLPLVDEEHNRFALLLLRGRDIDGYLFNSKNEIEGKLSLQGKARAYKQILGKTILENQDFVVFLTNKNRRKFASSSFSFATNSITFHEIDIDLGAEKIVQTAEYNNKFHILTIVPNTSIIHIYRFENDKDFTIHDIDFSNHSFLNRKQKIKNLYDMITVNSGFYGLDKSLDLVRIKQDDPITLEIACNPTKIYQNENYITITMDSNHDVTQLLDIDLKSLTGNANSFHQSMVNWSYKDKNSNSFVDEDILYQIESTRRVLHLRALNFRNGKFINEHSAHENENIKFKNSSIVQTGGTFDNHRTFEDTGVLLRKMNRGKIGIAVQNKGENKHISYGGVIERNANSGMVLPGFGIPIATFGAVTVYFNPTFFAYQSYTVTKAIQVDALFNSAFEHQNGQLGENPFEMIENFEIENNISPAGRTVFKMNGSYILGAYNAYNRTYTLRKFK